MNDELKQIAARIRELREILDITPAEAAGHVGITEEDYVKYESATKDIPVGVLYAIAKSFGIDPTVLLTGDSPRMDTYTVVRKGRGVNVDRYDGYTFSALAANYKNRDMDPMIVTLTSADEGGLVTHAGQEFNYVLEGEIQVIFGPKTLNLKAGDSIYFNPSVPHGQRAVTETAKFLTVINE